MRVLIVFPLIYALQSANTWAKLAITFEDIAWPVVDEEYYAEPDAYILDGYDDRLFMNFTVLKQIPPTSLMHYCMFGYANEGYVIRLGIDKTFPICTIFKWHTIATDFVRIFGFSEQHCQPLPGVYLTESFHPRTEFIPSVFPPNKYLVTLEILDGDRKLLVCQLFVKVQ